MILQGNETAFSNGSVLQQHEVAPTKAGLFDSLKRRLADRSAKVAVVGLGYVGLPLACRFAEVGFQTIAFDVDREKVRQLNCSQSYLSHISDVAIAQVRSSGKLWPTTGPDSLASADVIILCVPTPLNASRDPDLSYVEAAAKTVALQLRRGQLVVLESTTWPGTTREVLMPILEEQGLVAGKDFFVAYSPEREDPGNNEFSAENTPKIVSGVDDASGRLVAKLYKSIVSKVVPVASLETAEATKLYENIFRSVNIGLVNELKVIFNRLGIDIWSVIEAAKTKPFGFQAFYPGPGLGGHCIPIDPFYLSWLARKHNIPTRFVELAGQVNDEMPKHVLDTVTEALNKRGTSVNGSRICVLGVAYKRDIGDYRESPAIPLITLLRDRGAIVSFNDPYVSTLPIHRGENSETLVSREIDAELLEQSDAVIVVTDHSVYDYEDIARSSSIVVDTRNATRAIAEGKSNIWQA